MTKKTPLVVFTGLAVAAAGVLIAVLTGNYPGAEAPKPAAEAPAQTAPATPPAQPATQPEAQAETQAAAEAQTQTQGQTQAQSQAQDQSGGETAAAPDAAAQSAQQPAETPAESAATAPAQQPEPQQQASANPDAGATAPASPEAEAAANPDVPAFDTVNVMPTGEAVVAGRGKPGSEVALKFDGVEVGRATASADGSFAIVPDKPLPIGTGQLTLESTVDGKTLASKDQIAIVVKRDQSPALVARVDSAAATPTQIVQAPVAAADAGAVAKEVQLSAVDYDAEGNIVFQGRVTPGGTVRFYVDNQLAGDVKSDGQGNWMFKGTTPIAPGKHMLRADEIDATGKVLSRAELPFLREEADKVIAASEAAAPADAGQPAAAEAAADQPAAATASEATTAEAASQPEAAAQPDQQQAAAGNGSSISVSTSPTLPSRIVIQPGNNLWRISREVYGKGRLFTVIWEANRDQIKNPNRIYPGQILAAPKS
ncbi:MAG: LysM peptidoglycan-binding domain-containing protein [Rhizobiales bacterium]|nr:LysM peptidoglycan-binding domain-containing protein [Hyphomicrobiales bacterium]